jgi:transglutaminase-like putative cysteine protease
MLLESLPEAGHSMLLELEYRYTYDLPIRGLRHRIVAVPRARHGAQERTGWGFTVAGAVVEERERTDRFGNHVVELEAAEVDRELTVAIWSTMSWTSECRDEMRGPTALLDGDFVTPTLLTAASDELAAVAVELRGRSRSIDEFAERACSWTAHALTYEYGITGVRTTALAALEGGRGVCQDFAHVMLAICRSASVPACYVSGHLVGEGGSHAWVEVLNGTERLAYDPTHERRTDHRYLTVAIGREYGDVAPTSGSFHSGGPGTLEAKKRLSVLDPQN